MKILKEPTVESVTTINEDGSRYFLHPADARGRWTLWRRLFAVFLIAVYVLLPWIQINGHPAVFLDVFERRFHLFGFTFGTQDIWLGFFVITGVAFSLFYVTALFGRLWCGWACPYTVFLEHVYRRVERLLDGDGPAQRKLEDAPWTIHKIRRRVLKHGIFILISLAIAHVFLSYFLSLPRLYDFVKGPPSEHMRSFGIVMFLTGALYFSFAWFREQFCIIMCPYGRLQSALTDESTITIGYDAKRGDPRGKATNPDNGDCINCYRCVAVCPTGIDIRNGLQIECIGCANCIDACDEIMAKLKRPKGLVRYDSLTGLEGGKTGWLRPRVFLYTAFMLVGVVVMTFSLRSVKPVQMDVTRMMGAPYYVSEDTLRNHYQVTLLNKKEHTASFQLSVEDAPDGTVVMGIDGAKEVGPLGEGRHTLIVEVPREKYDGKFTFTVAGKAEPTGVKLAREMYFLGPDPRMLDDDYLESFEKTVE